MEKPGDLPSLLGGGNIPGPGQVTAGWAVGFPSPSPKAEQVGSGPR